MDRAAQPIGIKVLKQTCRWLSMLSDILPQYSTFDPDEFAREQAVVVQEIHQAEDTPDDIVFDHVQAIAYPGQLSAQCWEPLKLSPPSREAMKAYRRLVYNRLYRGGCVDHDTFVQQIEQAFTDIPQEHWLSPKKRSIGATVEFRS